MQMGRNTSFPTAFNLGVPAPEGLGRGADDSWTMTPGDSKKKNPHSDVDFNVYIYICVNVQGWGRVLKDQNLRDGLKVS